MNFIVKAGGAATALIAIGGVLAYLGSFIAWSSDVQRLDRKQAETAVDVHAERIERLLSIPPPSDPVQKQFWEESVRKARNNLDAAEKRKIELGK